MLDLRFSVSYVKQQLNFSNIKKEYYCAVNSNIPYCCYLFFIIIWPFIILSNMNVKYINIIDCKCSYIQCPICLILGRVNKLKLCSSETKCPNNCCIKQENKT